MQVIRDDRSFVAGSTIQDNIAEAIAQSDRTLAILSKDSRDRDWPHLERVLAEEVEQKTGTPLLIYLCLDETELPKHDSNRLAIRAKGKPLKEVGAEVLHAVAGVPLAPRNHECREDEPL